MDKKTVQNELARLVDRGEWSEIVSSPGEPIFRNETRPSDDNELIKVTSEIEYAVGVLEEVFPEYQRGVPLKNQGAAGAEMKRTLSACVATMSALGTLPPYWKNVAFNSTAIILTLRHVFATRSEVTKTVRYASGLPAMISNEIVQTVKRATTKVDSFLATVQTMTKDLDAATEKLAFQIRRI